MTVSVNLTGSNLKHAMLQTGGDFTPQIHLSAGTTLESAAALGFNRVKHIDTIKTNETFYGVKPGAKPDTGFVASNTHAFNA